MVMSYKKVEVSEVFVSPHPLQQNQQKLKLEYLRGLPHLPTTPFTLVFFITRERVIIIIGKKNIILLVI